jgi:hypothetical protein
VSTSNSGSKRSHHYKFPTSSFLNHQYQSNKNMAYRTEDLIQDCAAITQKSPTDTPAQAKRAKLFAMSFPNLSISTFDNVWSAILTIIRGNMKMNRGTRLPSFGRAVFTKDTKKPFFVMSEAFILPNKITFNQDIKAPELSSHDLNFSKIGQLAKCTKDAAKSIYRELISHLGEVISDANNIVHVQFKNIGVLTGNRFDLRFRFDGKDGKNGKGRPETTASFSKKAPATASGLSVMAKLANQTMDNNNGTDSARSSKRGGGISLGVSSSTTSLPKIQKGMSISKQIKHAKSGIKSGRSNKSNKNSKSAKKLPLNSLVAKKGHDPTYLNFDDLKAVNKSLMDTQHANDEMQRLSDEEEYRNTVLRLHAEATQEGVEIRKNAERRQEFADAQSLHAQRVEARKFVERNADIEAGEVHWPFSSNEAQAEINMQKKKEQHENLEEQTGGFEQVSMKIYRMRKERGERSASRKWKKQ